MTGKSPIELSGRIAGVDYGTVPPRSGGERSGSHDGQPAGDLYAAERNLDGKYFQQLALAEKITLWVVGLPVHLDGRESQKSQEARQFGKWLAEVTGLPVEFFDERFSSVQAEEILQAAELTRKRRRQRLDMLAAQIMLTAYLESQSKGQQPEALDD